MHTVVISGASQGLGRALAELLHAQGASLVLLARSKAVLDEIAAQHNANVKANPNSKDNQFTLAYPIDLTDAAASEQLAHDLTARGIVPDTLICCAGSSTPKLFTDLTIKELDAGIDTNYKTTVYLVHALLPLLTTNSSSTLVITSSTVAFYPVPGYGQYSPLKTALRALADTLAMELHPQGVNVHAFFPGNFASEGYAIENTTKPEITSIIEGPSTPITPTECAQKLLNGINRGEAYIHTDIVGWLLASFSLGLSPRCWWPLIPLQMLAAVLGVIIGRFVALFHRSQVDAHFHQHKQ